MRCVCNCGFNIILLIMMMPPKKKTSRLGKLDKKKTFLAPLVKNKLNKWAKEIKI